MKFLRDIVAALILIAAIVTLWSWASNLGPQWLLAVETDVIECDDCRFDDLSRCQACIDIFDGRMPD